MKRSCPEKEIYVNRFVRTAIPQSVVGGPMCQLEDQHLKQEGNNEWEMCCDLLIIKTDLILNIAYDENEQFPPSLD